MCPRAAPTCDICKKLVSKYKCPSCLVPYCSLGCFKIHKETPCAKPSGPSSTVDKPAASPAKEVSVERPEEANDVVEKTQHKASASPAKEVSVERPEEANDVVEKTQHKASAESPAKEIPVARPIHVEEEKYVLEKTHFEAIASSSEIREALKDEALQKLIYRIDSSSNPLQELDGAMGIEAFREFTDKILSNISKSSDEQFLATTCLAEAQL
ncbi:zinc finger HIT domain-containing protein 3 isoform X3 [Arabidopsis lyrata subsp. lyrata]|uniref:zinc finger HIT domain-containing protein 3 isoform X3 n=1 Tax=Arabidopsis lyrata subsp. lyrata TaxID=81972 RepID=UPI000A29AF8E|nr:zinc finger HIT domain-containing protein 3 isoform X3 [Arabidopsis lyrata subsp. lyrata]|eukprot:XP_020873899.1 zinc finger HIT domain-containing protein 3 isoform X3 [Arabidopsis lyrata subsp. lyrata]